MLEEMGPLPLAIAQAADIMRENSITVLEYLQMYRCGISNRETLLSHEFAERGRNMRVPNAVIANLLILLDLMGKEEPPSGRLDISDESP